MNESQVRTLAQVREVLAGTAALAFTCVQHNHVQRYAWIGAVLKRFGYRRLPRADRGAVLAYLQRPSGYSRAQVKRLVKRWCAGERLHKRYGAPAHAFARRYTPTDVALLAEVDRAMDTLSGPATACVLRRQYMVFGEARYQRLANLSVAHLYNPRLRGGRLCAAAPATAPSVCC